MPTLLRRVIALLAVVLLAPAELRADIMYVTDPTAQQIYQVISTATPGGLGTNDPLPQDPTMQINQPRGIVLDTNGNLYVADAGTNKIYLFTRGPQGSGFDGFGTLTQSLYASGANLSSPYGLALDSAGNLYAANVGNGSVVKIQPGGDTVNGGQVIVAPRTLNFPQAIAVGPTGLIYVAPFFSAAVNVFDNTGNSVGTISTINYSPNGLTFDQAGNLYISEILTGNPSRVVQQPIDPVTGLATGTANPLYGGFGLTTPTGMAFDPQGNLYVLDAGQSPSNIDRVPVGGGSFVVFRNGFFNPAFIAVLATPEPSSLALLGMAASAMAGYGWWGRRRRSRPTDENPGPS